MADDRLDDDLTGDDFDGGLGDEIAGNAGALPTEDDWSGGFYQGVQAEDAAETDQGDAEEDRGKSKPSRRAMDLKPLFTGKNGAVALSSIVAAPALVVVVLTVLVIFKYAGIMNSMMLVLAGFTLLVCFGITIMPIGIFLFGVGGPEEGTDQADGQAGKAEDSLDEGGVITDEGDEFEPGMTEDAESLGSVDEATFDEFEFNVDDFVEDEDK